MRCCDILGFALSRFSAVLGCCLPAWPKSRYSTDQIVCWSHIPLKQTGSGVGGNLACQKSFRSPCLCWCNVYTCNVRVRRRRITLEEWAFINVESYLCIDDKADIYRFLHAWRSEESVAFCWSEERFWTNRTTTPLRPSCVCFVFVFFPVCVRTHHKSVSFLKPICFNCSINICICLTASLSLPKRNEQMPKPVLLTASVPAGLRAAKQDKDFWQRSTHQTMSVIETCVFCFWHELLYYYLYSL